jgi:hypothetical protein
MRRLIAVVSVLAMTLLGLVAIGGPAQAKVPGPNGQIVFSRFNPDTETADIFVANPDGTHTHEVPLPIPAEGFGGAFWSPDGTKLLITNLIQFDDNGELLPFRPATVNPDGSDFRVLEPPGAPFDMFCDAWSPDATRILCGFGGDAPGVFSIRASDGGDPVRLSTNPYGAGELPGDYSPDGTHIVFMRTKPGAGSNPDRTQQGALFVAKADGTEPRQITPYGLANSHDNAFAHWSPDGREILFGSAQGLLYLVHPNGGGLTPIHLQTDGGSSLAFAPGWSPDGTRIIFSFLLRNVGQEDIYTAKADGTDLVQVTDTPDEERFADWGPHPLAT